jgi:hypothetical protein
MTCRQCGQTVRNLYGNIQGCHGCYQRWLGINSKASTSLYRCKKSLERFKVRAKQLGMIKKTLEAKIQALETQNKMLRETINSIGMINR